MPKKHRQVRSFWANGRRFRVRTQRGLRQAGESIWGWFSSHEGEVRIDSQAKEETLLDVRIHEFTHGFFDGGNQALLHEDTVNRFATDLMRYLWRCGYRCHEDSEWSE